MPMPGSPSGGSLWASAYVVGTARMLPVLAGLALVLAVVRGLRPARLASSGASLPGGQGQARRYAAAQVLRVGFGWLWILAAALQVQPGMAADFAHMIIVPAAAGQPGAIAGAARAAASWWSRAPVAWDTLVIAIQAAIGAGLLLGRRRWLTVALYVSTVWGLIVWSLGEGLGQVDRPGPGASFLTGAPGSALCYVAAGAVLLALPARWEQPPARRRLARVLPGLLGVTLLAGAGVQALPAERLWAPHGLAGVFSATADAMRANGDPKPAWALAAQAASMAARSPLLANAAVTAVLTVMAVAACWLPRRAGWWTVGGLALGIAAMWYFGQGLGVLEPMPTDPNTGAALLVMLAAAWLARLEDPGRAVRPARDQERPGTPRKERGRNRRYHRGHAEPGAITQRGMKIIGARTISASLPFLPLIT